MKSLVEHLSQYASYHRDRRNIATHVVGIPMIVVGVEALMSRPAVHLFNVADVADIAGVALSPALLATIAAGAFYLALDLRYGLVMAAVLVASLAAGAGIAAQPPAIWLLGAAGLFLGGWVVQFVGHAFEGKKPAFVDDVVGLLVGPLFVAAEVGFALGLRDEVREQIERRAGPTHGRTIEAFRAR